MKRSDSRLLFDAGTLYEQSILLTVLLAIYYYLFSVSGWFCGIPLFVWWIWRTKDRSWIWFVIVFLIVSIRPFFYHAKAGDIGIVTTVKTSYALIDTGHGKLMVYTDDSMTPDEVVQVFGQFRQPEENRGFWRFSYSNWFKENGICAAVYESEICSIRQLPTVRYLLFKKIQSIDNEKRRTAYERILLNIRSNDDDSFLNDRGFSISAVLVFLDSLFQYFLKEKKRRRWILFIGTALTVFYRFPVAGVQALLFRVFDIRNQKQRKKADFGLLLLLFLFPSCIRNPAFVMNLIFRQTNRKKDLAQSFLISSLYQSLVFHHVYPIEILLYGTLRSGIGFLYVIAWVFLSLKLPFEYPFYYGDVVLNLSRMISFPGTILGFGLPLFIAICMFFKRQRFFAMKALLALYVLLGLGWFHPFGEITFLNVGQGDAILIRAPFNQCNILLDTGKASQWNNLDGFLEAKGITELEVLFLSHHDDDHDANQQRVVEKYHAEVVDQHFDAMDIGPFVFFDLNTDKAEENPNSLVLVTEVNGLSFLFAGDIDKETETEIIHSLGSFSIDVLKAAHHGSDTACCDLFLDTIQPKIAVLSCGSYNLYHHPAIQVLERLSKRHISALLTREEGDITFLFFSFGNVVFSTKKVVII